MVEQGKPAGEVEKFGAMFSEVQRVVDSKQLHPMIRTQYMRTAFQIPFDATVRVSLDTNLTMIKENPDSGPSCAEAGRCASRLLVICCSPEQVETGGGGGGGCMCTMLGSCACAPADATGAGSAELLAVGCITCLCVPACLLLGSLGLMVACLQRAINAPLIARKLKAALPESAPDAQSISLLQGSSTAWRQASLPVGLLIAASARTVLAPTPGTACAGGSGTPRCRCRAASTRASRTRCWR